MFAREDVNAQSDARDSGSQSVPNSEWHSDRRVRSRRSSRIPPRPLCEAQAADFSAQRIATRPARYRSRRAASKSCCAQERDFTGNNNVLRISCDRIPVDESETALPSLDVKTDSDAIAIRLLWNLHFAGVRSSNCNSRRLPSIFGGYPRADMARPLAMTPMSKLARIPRGTHRKKYSHGALTFLSGTCATLVK